MGKMITVVVHTAHIYEQDSNWFALQETIARWNNTPCGKWFTEMKIDTRPNIRCNPYNESTMVDLISDLTEIQYTEYLLRWGC